jgi:hypothetical protein
VQAGDQLDKRWRANALWALAVALYGAPKVATKELPTITTVIDWNNHLSYKRAAAFAGGLALCIVHPFTFASALRRLG